jgi:hypothetical protein
LAYMGKKRTGEDRIWEIWGRRQQGRTEYGKYGEEENRGRAGDMGKKRTGEDRIWYMYGEEENRVGQNMKDMEKKGTGEDRIGEIRREQGGQNMGDLGTKRTGEDNRILDI